MDKGSHADNGQRGMPLRRDNGRKKARNTIPNNGRCFEPEYNFLAARARFLLEMDEGGMINKKGEVASHPE